MPTISHKNLTGLQLHENKGVDSATVDQVATANGSGATVWKKLTADNLAASANPFGAGLLHLQDSVSSSTVGQTLTTTTWNKRTLQTVVTNEISASLASSQITLGVGTYYIEAEACHHSYITGTFSSKLRLYNTTTAAALLYGTSAVLVTTASTTPSQMLVVLRGRFTLAGSSVLELQHYTNGGGSTGGQPAGISSINEIYADVRIWKVA